MARGARATCLREGCGEVDIKRLLSRFHQGGLADEGGPDPLDLDGARRARAASRMVPPPGSIRRTRASSGAGAGRRGGPWSAAAERGPGPACGDQSEAGRRTLQRGVRFRSNARSRGVARPHCLSRPHSFDSMATCEIHRRRECHWHANWYHPILEVSFSRRVSFCPPCSYSYARRRRVAKPAVRGPRERQSSESSLTFHSSGSRKRTPRSSRKRLTVSALASYHTAHS